MLNIYDLISVLLPRLLSLLGGTLWSLRAPERSYINTWNIPDFLLSVHFKTHTNPQKKMGELHAACEKGLCFAHFQIVAYLLIELWLFRISCAGLITRLYFCLIIKPLPSDYEIFISMQLKPLMRKPGSTTWLHLLFHSFIPTLADQSRWDACSLLLETRLLKLYTSCCQRWDNIGVLNLPRSTRSMPSVDQPERSNENQPVVRRYSQTRAQTMEVTECFLRACPTTGGFLRGQAL